MGKLIITDLRKLQITKVKPWSIYFIYDDEKYLLHGSGDGGDYGYNLFKRIFNQETKKYYLEYIKGEYTWDDDVESEFIKVKNNCKRVPLVYNQIDKEYFVNEMYKWKFIELDIKK